MLRLIWAELDTGDLHRMPSSNDELHYKLHSTIHTLRKDVNGFLPHFLHFPTDLEKIR